MIASGLDRNGEAGAPSWGCIDAGGHPANLPLADNGVTLTAKSISGFLIGAITLLSLAPRFRRNKAFAKG